MRSSCCDPQFNPGFQAFICRRYAVMPVVVVLHERHSLTLDRMRNDCHWFPAAVRKLREYIDQRPHVMPIHFTGAPAKGAPFVRKRLQCHNFLAAARGLPFIKINDDSKVVNFLCCRQHRGLPDRALVTFAVTQERKDLIASLLYTRRQCHAERDRQSVPESAGGSLDPRQFIGCWRMFGKYSAVLSVIGQHGLREKTAHCQYME